MDEKFSFALGYYASRGPVWMVNTIRTQPRIREHWATHPEQNALTGVTSFEFSAEVPREVTFVGLLDVLDLHHGLSSALDPYTLLEAVGVALSPELEAKLREAGYSAF